MKNNMLRTSCKVFSFAQCGLRCFESPHTRPWTQYSLNNCRFISIQGQKKAVEVKKRVGKKKNIGEVVGRKGYWNISAFSTGDEYKIEELAQTMKDKDIFEPTVLGKELQNPDFLHAIVKQENGQEPQEVFVFREGAVVAWNLSEIDVEVLLSLVKKFQIGAYTEEIVRDESEHMNYTYGDAGVKTRLVEDDFVLESHDETRLDKYALSNAMALTVKLGTWEAILAGYIDSMEDVTNDLKQGSKIRMSQEAVLRKTGELFALRHAVNLSSDLLDTPDIYWDREELEKVYQLTLSYFSINKRTKVINEKLNHCLELVELLSSHLRDNHHVRLEWMIIILIMVEVAFETLHYFEPHKNISN